MARRSSQKDIEPTRMVNRLMEGLSQTKFFGCHKNVPGSLSHRTPQTQITSSMQTPEQYPSPCADLFEYLRDIDWVDLSCPPVQFESDPFKAMFGLATCFVPNLPHLPLGRRQVYVEAFALSQRYIRASSMANLSREEAKISSIHAMVNQVQRTCPLLAMGFGYEELSRICSHYIDYGCCWDDLKSRLQTDEVLLIDQKFSFDSDNPNSTFSSSSKVWLCSSLGLKQFCQKLSGMSQMISNLMRTEQNSEARVFLASKILDRLDEVLGPRPPSPITGYNNSYFPIAMHGSPAEGDVYSLSDSVGAEESDDSFSLSESRYRTASIGGCFNQNIWNT